MNLTAVMCIYSLLVFTCDAYLLIMQNDFHTNIYQVFLLTVAIFNKDTIPEFYVLALCIQHIYSNVSTQKAVSYPKRDNSFNCGLYCTHV